MGKTETVLTNSFNFRMDRHSTIDKKWLIIFLKLLEMETPWKNNLDFRSSKFQILYKPNYKIKLFFCVCFVLEVNFANLEQKY